MELIITNHPRIRRGARVERDEATAKKLISLKWAIQANKPNGADQQLQSLKVNHPTQKPLRLSNKMLEQALTKYRKEKK